MNLVGHSLKLLNSPYPKTNYTFVDRPEFPFVNKIALPKPIDRKISYDQVITSRHSKREYFGPLDLTELSSLLWDVLKIKKIEVDHNGTVSWIHRGAPSAGGLASVDAFITNIAGYNDKLFFYNPYDHSLQELNVTPAKVKEVINASNELIDVSHATLFIYAAHVTNIFSKYENPESLIWRDVGAIYAMMNLSSESLNLDSCSLGTTFHPLLPKVLGTEGLLFGVGGQIFGKREHDIRTI